MYYATFMQYISKDSFMFHNI